MIKPASEVKHTAGALRAAQEICVCGHSRADHKFDCPNQCVLVCTQDCLCDGFQVPDPDLHRLRKVNAELLEALQEIVDAADQSNGGKGAELPWSLHVREIAATALRKAAKEGR